MTSTQVRPSSTPQVAINDIDFTMMTTIDEMHRLMQDMQAETQHMPGMRPMQGRMGRAMGMAQQMRGMMGEHRSQMQHACPALPTETPAARPGKQN